MRIVVFEIHDSDSDIFDKIYRKVWGEDAYGDESNAIGCHIRCLREKLYEAEPDDPFTIRWVREVGYCFEVSSE